LLKLWRVVVMTVGVLLPVADSVSAQGEAESAECTKETDPVTGAVTRVDCPTDAVSPGNPGSGGSGGSASDRACTYDTDPDKPGDENIACVSKSGVWNTTLKCYLRRADPQPEKSDPAWGGHDDGVIYSCYNKWAKGAPSIDNPGTLRMVWFAKPSEADPAVLAQHAVDSMGLEAIEIGLPVPKDDDHMIYVGAPVWMWVANPGPETTGPNEASATAGAVTVSVKARLTAVEWHMGEGRTVFCRGEHRAKGTKYKPAFGMADSPTCGYRYQHPTKRATIQAVSHWSIDWHGGGQGGTITMELTRRTTRPVGEIQALIKTH
jgi:hypothetical protein